jgi:hypothetical protein
LDLKSTYDNLVSFINSDECFSEPLKFDALMEAFKLAVLETVN